MTQVKKKDYRVVLDALTSLNCPISLSVAILLRYGEFEQIVNKSFDPLWFNDVDTARNSLCAIELLKKNRFINIKTIDKEQTALSAFVKAEEACRDTNERLLRGNPDYDGLLFSISRKIANILGDFSAGELLNLSGWGPGVTLTLRSGNNTLFKKFRHDGEVTPNFYNTANVLLSALSPHWSPKLKVFEGSRVITVPKNAKTDRVIAVEPSINLFFQKGIGKMISSRLKRWGIDLNTQVRNQELSRSGSFSAQLATVDFSSASDTIAYRLVLDLLPWNWFEVLDVLRSPRGLLGDTLIEYEKFSSMGNGFTFELESLIFFATALVVCEELGEDASSVSVFGDDVILPNNCYDRYSEVCKYLGFSVNMTKSYSSSYFRESCGSYWWNGVCIKPVRLLESTCSYEGSYSFHNRLTEFDGRAEYRKPVFLGLCHSLRNSVKNPCLVPPSYGDSGFIITRPIGFYSIKTGLYRFRYLSQQSEHENADDLAVMLTHLWHQSRASLDDTTLNRFQTGVGGSNVNASVTVIGNDCVIPRSGRRVVRRANLSHWC